MKTIQPKLGLAWKNLIFSLLVIGALITQLPVYVVALPANSLPSTGTNVSVINGSATIPTIGTGTTGNLTITATSANTILSWQNFWDGTAAGGSSSPGDSDSITFTLPSSSASILNQVDLSTGLSTTINGTISSNGKVFLLNPNGITIGSTGDINCASFYASTIAENIGYFQANGTLQIFSSSPQNATPTGNITVNSGATLTTVGGGGDIRLAGLGVSVAGGGVQGNLYLNAQGGPVSISGSETVAATGSGGGNLYVTSNGGSVSLSGTQTIVQGNVVVNSTPLTPNTAGGAVSSGGSGILLDTPSSSLTIVTSGSGTGAAGAISLGSVDAPVYYITGGNTSINDPFPSYNDVRLGTSSITGTLTVTSANGNITNVSGQTVAATGAISLAASAPNRTITFAGSGNVTFGTISANATNGAATLSSTGNVTLASAVGPIPTLSVTAGGDLNVNGGISGTPTLTLTSTGNTNINSAISGVTTFTGTAGGNITGNGSGSIDSSGATGTLALTAGGNIQFLAPIGGTTPFKTIALTSTGGFIGTWTADSTTSETLTATGNISVGPTTTKALTVTSGGKITASNAITSAVGGTGSVSFTAAGDIAQTAPITGFATVALTSTGGNIGTWAINAATSETVTATGNISLGADTAPTLTVTSSGGNITQNAVGGALTSSGTATFASATGTDLYTHFANALTGTTILTGGGTTGVKVANAGTLTIGNGTAVSGPATLLGANVVFGTAAADTITFGGTLNATATGSGFINTIANNLWATGNVTLITTGTGTINLGTAAAAGTYGQVSASTGSGAITLISGGQLNLGAITTTGALAATSLTSNIVNTATTAGADVVAAGASTFSSSGSIQIGSAPVGATSNAAALSGTVTVAKGSSLSLWNSVATTIASTSTTALGSASVWVTNGGNLTFTTPTTGISAISFNMNGGNVSISDLGALTLWNSVNTGAGSVTVSDAGAITLGSGIALAGTGAVSLTSTGTSAGITDTASSPISIGGNLSLTSAAGINVANNTANNVAGSVLLTQTGAGSSNIAYTQGNSVNLAGIVVGNLSSVESVSIQSVNGTILQTGGIGLSGSTTSVSFSAPNGQVLLNALAGSSSPASNFFGGAATQLSISAEFSSSVVAHGALNFGNVSVTNGSFYASTTGNGPGNSLPVGGQTITQATGTTFTVSGDASFVTEGGAVTLANTGNSFGTVSLDTTDLGTLTAAFNTNLPAGIQNQYEGAGSSAGASASIKTIGNGSYVSVLAGTAGDLTLVSETGNIAEATPASNSILLGGHTVLTASSGSITLNGAGNRFGGTGGSLLITTGSGNAAITDGAGTTILANGTSVGGNLTITNTNANGVIKDSGPSSKITVGGNAIFSEATTGTGWISLLGTNNSLGAIQLIAGSGTSTIYSNTSLTLLQGSNVKGPITFNVFGNFATSGPGGSTFGNTVRVNANGTGNITFGTPVFITGALTVNGTGTEDLSFLSIAANLNGITPTNLGTGTYKAPQP